MLDSGDNLLDALRWALYRVGTPRPAQETDDNSAILDAATSTLTLQDVHVGGRVYGDVRLLLANQHWQIDGTPQPMVALSEDDFVSDPALAATPDNVVILKLEARPGDGTVADTGGAGIDPSTKFPCNCPPAITSFALMRKATVPMG